MSWGSGWPAMRIERAMVVVLVALWLIGGSLRAADPPASGQDTVSRPDGDRQGGGDAGAAGRGNTDSAGRAPADKSKTRDFKPTERIGVGTAVPFPADI